MGHHARGPSILPLVVRSRKCAGAAKRPAPTPGLELPRLTHRELDILKLVARGRLNREIAAELFISENTVRNHIRNILDKLQMHSRMEAAMYAVRQRLIDPGE